MIEVVNPLSLLSVHRYDFAVKWRYFRHLIAGKDNDSERIYRWHILKRTGGNEPRSPKNTIDDYIRECDVLLRSIEGYGFDPAFAVKIGANNKIVGSGAHRISCCMALGCGIAIRRVDRDGLGMWGLDWFLANGMARHDIACLESDWDKLKAMK